MDDASEKYAQQIETARLAAGRGDRSAAVAALTAAIETTRLVPAMHREHAAALVRLGILEQELGRPAEAEQLLTEAIAIGERNLGTDHPSLGAALNELSRLHIRQSDYSRAEPVLKRLLTIARAKGDRHADVATALAGLAVAKRGLGEAASAELLYRHALRIREEVLAPDHMAIVINLEQLSETCAARGRVAEALVLLQRALLKRERALGVDHATVRGARARIAELERRVAKPVARAADRPAVRPAPTAEVAPAPAAPPSLGEPPAHADSPSAGATADWRATPARPRSAVSITTQPERTNELVFLYKPERPASRPPFPSRERVPTPAGSVAAVSPIADVAEPSFRTQSAALGRVATATQGTALTRLPDSAVSPALAMADGPVIGASSRDISDLFSSVKRATLYGSAGAAVIALAIAGFDFSSSGASEGESERAPVATGAAPRVAVVPTSVTAKPKAMIAVSTPVATTREARTAPASSATQPTRVGETHDAVPSDPVATPNLRRVVVPRVATPSVDSLMQSATNIVRGADSEPIAAAGSLLTSPQHEDVAVTRPVLTFAPSLRFPDALRAQRVEGEVVVQFRVNEKGRVEASSMQVVHSGHDLFTAEVRNALPRFRFEPARLAAPGSKPQSAWVQFRAQFNARN